MAVSGVEVRGAGRDRLAYPILLAIGALDAAGYSIIAPVLPAIARETGAGPALIGVMVAAFPLAMLAGFALAGAALPRFGARAVLVGSLVGVALGAGGFVAGETFGAFIAARVVMGLASGGLWIGVTFETLERWPGQEYLCMSRIFAAYSAGGLLGPLLGALGGIHAPFAAYIGVAVAGAVAASLLRPPAQRRSFAADARATRTPGFAAAALGILFAVLALGVVEGVLPLHFAAHLTQQEVGITYAAASLVVATSAAAAARFPPRPLLIASVLLVTIGLTVAGAASTPAVWLVALLGIAIGVGAGNTGSTGVLLETVAPERIVLAMVVWSQIGIVGYLIGPLAGGVLAEAAGFPLLGVVPAIVGALVLVQLSRVGSVPTGRRRGG